MIYNRNKSDYSLNVGKLILSGVEVTTDLYGQTLSNAVVLNSDISFDLPNFRFSAPTTGESLAEQYINNSFHISGCAVFCSTPGVGPGHLSMGLSGTPIMSPLSGRLYLRDVTGGNFDNTVATFTLDSGQYYNETLFDDKIITGGKILGIDTYRVLSGLEDFNVILFGRHFDVTPNNEEDGAIITSGDNSISFYLDYGYKGNAVYEHYTPYEFIANRWSINSSKSGTASLDPFAPDLPLYGSIYWRDINSSTKNHITDFMMDSGELLSYDTFIEKTIPFRSIVGVDIQNGLYGVENLNLVLGGRSMVYANLYKTLLTNEKFNILSGELVNMLEDAVAGVVFLNGAQGILNITGGDGIEVSRDDRNIFVKYIGGTFDPNNYGFVDQSQTGVFALSYDVSGLSGIINDRLNSTGINLLNYIDSRDSLVSGNLTSYTNQIVNQSSGANYSFATGAIEQSRSSVTAQFQAGDLSIINNLINTGSLLFNYSTDVSGFSRNYTNTISGILNSTIVNTSGILESKIVGDSNLASGTLTLAMFQLSGELRSSIPTIFVTGINTFSGGVNITGSRGINVINNSGLISIDINTGFFDSGYAKNSNTGSFITSDILNSFSGFVESKKEDKKQLFKSVSSDYTFNSNDSFSMINFDSANGITGYFSSGYGFSSGDKLSICQLGDGAITLSGISGVELMSRNGLKSSNGKFSVINALCFSETGWLIYGDLI